MKTHPLSRSRAGAIILLGSATLVSCGGGGGGCDATDPACGGTSISSISVSSPIDSVIAVGSTTRLVAAELSPSGSLVGAPVTWSSSDQSVATVSTSGLVSALAAGETTITASAGGTSTQYSMRAVEARLTDVTAVLTDPLVTASIEPLSGSISAALTDIVDQCQGAVLEGYVLAVEACLDAADSQGSGDGNDQALLGVLGLFFDFSRGLLDLGR